jgi:hypothetical protein
MLTLFMLLSCFYFFVDFIDYQTTINSDTNYYRRYQWNKFFFSTLMMMFSIFMIILVNNGFTFMSVEIISPYKAQQ